MNGSRSVAWLVLVLVLAIGAGGTAFGKTINMPADYATIQAAITAAANGEVVVVAEGTYKENLNFKGKAITVRSTDPTNQAVVKATIINGSKKGSVVTFKSGETAACVLSGFTITNGTGTPVDGLDYALMGGGVFCNESSPTLTNNTISGNKADNGGDGGDGGGVGCEDSSPTLTNNTISGNSATDGGGVECEDSSPTLTNNTISGNSATGGGGVRCDDSSSPTLTNNIISGNKAGGDGGGVGCFAHEFIASDRSSLTLTNNTISGNSAGGGDGNGRGGGVMFDGRSATLTNNTISGNWVNDGDGGGVWCGIGSLTLTNDTISGNSATLGGGVYCGGSSPIIKNTIIALSTKGGGLYCDNGDRACNPVVTYCDVWGNVGGDYVQWPNQTGKHGNLSQDPLFADAAARDFHLKSTGGRWTAAGWVLDTVTSPCLDAGDPKSAFNLEPAPNGARINMGAYGGTIYASKSP